MFLLKNIKLTFTHSSRLISTSAIYNAGHSKWANIKHDKAIKDGKRSFLFQKLGRQIRVAIQGNNFLYYLLNNKLNDFQRAEALKIQL